MRTAASKMAGVYKNIRVTNGPWKRARICAIESGKTLLQWITEAIAAKADQQEREGKLTRRGARVISDGVVQPLRRKTDGESGVAVQAGTGAGARGRESGEGPDVGEP